jgi:hypothetical protein
VGTDGSTRLYDYGARISVRRPTSAETITLDELAHLFGSAPTG